MIRYNPGGGLHFFMRLLQMTGSVFPKSLYVAVPCGIVAAVLKILIKEEILSIWEPLDSILSQSQAWSGFSGLVGFLVVFRTSQSYIRFWGGCTATHQMRAEWFDACSAVFAFCTTSKASPQDVEVFQAKLVRLFSMLHAAALAELEEMNHDTDFLDEIQAFGYRLIDPQGLGTSTLEYLKESDCKVELLFSWIQAVLVQAVDAGVISVPPPIVSRSFQELANGMVAFHDAVKITYIPFPFPYAQICDLLLVFHWVSAPVVITQWVTEPWWAAFFVFIQVFVLWSLNFIACEIENPFGTDANDLDGWGMQEEMNRHLLLLTHPHTREVPQLAANAISLSTSQLDKDIVCNMSFNDIWDLLEVSVPVPARKGKSFCRGSQLQLKVLPSEVAAPRTLSRQSRLSMGVLPSEVAAARTMSGQSRLSKGTASPDQMECKGTGSAPLPPDPLQACGYTESSKPPPACYRDGPLRAVQRPCRRSEEGQAKASKPAATSIGGAAPVGVKLSSESGWRQRAASQVDATSPSNGEGSRSPGVSPREPSSPGTAAPSLDIRFPEEEEKIADKMSTSQSSKRRRPTAFPRR